MLEYSRRELLAMRGRSFPGVVGGRVAVRSGLSDASGWTALCKSMRIRVRYCSKNDQRDSN